MIWPWTKRNGLKKKLRDDEHTETLREAQDVRAQLEERARRLRHLEAAAIIRNR